MKRLVVIIAFFLSLGLSAQDDSRLGIFVGYSKLPQYFSDEMSFTAKHFALEYQDRIFPVFTINYGVSFYLQNVDFVKYKVDIGPREHVNVNQNLLSLYTKIKFYNFLVDGFYLHFAPSIDFELKDIDTPGYIPQNGLSVSMGLGYEIPVKNIVIALEPSMKFKKLWAFKKSEYADDFEFLFVYNFNLGVSYKFF